MRFVPVVDLQNNPLMPTSSNRARSWIKSRKATPFWKRGIFCVRLNVEPSNRNLQVIACGIDPGSKKEGYTVKSESHTYLNIQANAVTWVKGAVKTRKMLRQSRRNRKTPYRQHRLNKASKRLLAPSIKACLQWKLRISKWLQKIYPINYFVVEDIKATSWKGAKKWNRTFSPLQTCKKWFYSELAELGRVETKLGYETAGLRKIHNLKKSSNKQAETFEAHCVDSWVLANWFVGGHVKPDNKQMLLITPLQFHRRMLHRQKPVKGGGRTRYGGTISLGFKRGSIVKYSNKSNKYAKKKIKGVAYVSGNYSGYVILRSLETGETISGMTRPQHIKFLSYNSWRTSLAKTKTV